MKRAWFCIIVLALPCIYAARDQKYYRILGISDDADEQTIKKAYRKAAMKWHPDRNQDKKEKAEEKFREIAAAYETLSDPEKKRIYDQLGEEGLKQNAGPGGGGGGPGGQGPSFTFQGDPFDIFSQVFGGANPFGQGGAGGGGMGGMGGMMGGMGGMPGMGGMGGMPGGGGRRKRPSGQQAGGGGGLYDGEPAVVKVDSSNFPGKSDTQAWLLEFYAPWCGHCRNLVPKWSKVANSLKGIVKVGAVNCDEEKQLCAQHGVQGYPTIKSWAKGRMQDYNGDRSAAALKTFGLSLLSSKAVKTLNRPAQVTEFLKLGESKDSKSASWGANVILFTSKSDTAPLTKSLASQFEGKIAFGESRASNKALAELFKVTSYPTMLAFCNGDTGSVIRYQGDFKAAPLAKFMREFQSGKKCQKMIKIDANTDLSKFRVSQLKELLQERDVNCIECTEKKDFVKRLQELLQDRTEL